MYASALHDLRRALWVGDLGVLDPFPFIFAAGCTLGWIIYGYFQWDPFLVAANLPGFFVSLWLNYGAAKLQYYRVFQRRMERNATSSHHHNMVAQQQGEERWDASPPLDSQEEEEEVAAVLGGAVGSSMGDTDDSHPDLLFFVPQETNFFRIMVAWAILATYASWFTTDKQTASTLCGWAVNVNMVFFYGAPLHTIRSVVRTHDSSAIHRPTLSMSLINTSFWMLYGVARTNVVIVAPNAAGFLLGVAQSILCMYYPVRKGRLGAVENGTTRISAPSSIHDMTPQPIAQDVDDFV